MKTAFLDRDGVVNIDKGYVHTVHDFVFTENFFSACSILAASGYSLVIVTNQSGIARGFYTEDDFQSLNTWLKHQFIAQGLILDSIYHCPHMPDSVCNCRKPKPGMVLEHLFKTGTKAKDCIMFGDKPSDAACAKSAGIGQFFMIDVASNPSHFYDTVVQSSLAGLLA